MNKPNQTKIGIITQARMTSTRLPGKILKEICQKSLLHYHIERLQQTGLDVAIATTSNATDDAIQLFAEKHHLPVYRGSEQNVLQRFYETAKKFDLDIIVRVTSDCPFIDQYLIRNAVEKYVQMNNENLYMSNVLERTFARGFDFEIFSSYLLNEAFQQATSETDLEHVTPYIWNNRSGHVEFYHVKQTVNHSDLRITVDTAADFELIRQLIATYHADQLSYTEIETILMEHPELIGINKHIEQKKL